MSAIYKYVKEDITVIWQPGKCMHSGVCVKGLADVFDPRRKPWIDVSKAKKELIIKQVKCCPSGALSLAPGNDLS